jgi:Flp pilus assembly protein TadG
MMRFLNDKRGVIAMMFGLMFPVVIAAMGLGYDLAQAYMARARLSQALDASGLAVAGSNVADMQSRFEAYMHANYPDLKLGTVKGLSFTQVGNDIIVTGTATVDTSFMKWFGKNSLDVYATAQIHRELQGLEVALVLDNTGSMRGTKLANLKDAAKNLITTLEEAAERSTEEDAVKIALVPYTMTVNVGNTYASAAWLDSAGQSTVARQMFSGTSAINRLNLFTSMSRTWGGCVEMRASPYDVTESPPTSDANTKYVPYFAVDEPDSSNSTYGGPYYNNYRPDGTTSTNWLTRQSNPNKYNGVPNRTGTNSIGYQYGPNSGCEIQPLTRLTDNFTGLRNAIDANSAVGMMWGWHVLSPYGPFADGVAYGTERQKKIIILMTDGQNANVVINNNDLSAYSGIGYIWQNRIGITGGNAATRAAAMDAKQAAICANAKQAGITIYTIRLETPNADKTTIEGCATAPDYFYDVSSSTELDAVFYAIANSIQNLRLAK